MRDYGRRPGEESVQLPTVAKLWRPGAPLRPPWRRRARFTRELIPSAGINVPGRFEEKSKKKQSKPGGNRSTDFLDESSYPGSQIGEGKE